jgi:hypothetical protein
MKIPGKKRKNKNARIHWKNTASVRSVIKECHFLCGTTKDTENRGKRGERF